MQRHYAVPNGTLALNGPISQLFLSEGIQTYSQAVQRVHQLPYGRNSDRSAFDRIFEENRGTCSTKHAALAALAQEQKLPVELALIIGRLDRKLHPGCASLLERIDCEYLPEAHCFLQSPLGDCDISFPEQSSVPRMKTLQRYSIQPHEIGEAKERLHRKFLSKWMETEGIGSYTFNEVWSLREQWIQELTNPLPQASS